MAPRFRMGLRISTALATLVAGAAFAYSPSAFAQEPDAVARGAYVFSLAGCEGCHTDKKGNGPRLAGGRVFKTDFGTFITPNITPDPVTGIGRWSFEDFRTAMRAGEAPDGSNYFPAFPYTSYTHITDQDLEDLWAYLQSQPPMKRANQGHDLKAPYGWRWLMPVWNAMNLDAGPKPEWSRGRYIAEALSHCQECHTPRDSLGGYDNSKPYAGTARNPEGIAVPNITPDRETGIGKWPKGDLDLLFTIGMLPDGDFVGGVMAESISHATSKMTKDDRAALLEHLGSLRPIVNRIKVEKARKSGG